MLNDPSSEQKNKRQRRPHPLEQRPEPPAKPPTNPDDPAPQQRVILHIPVAKPSITYALIAVNVLIFFVVFYMLSPRQFNDLYDWGANNRRAVFDYGEFHRLFTSMFLHGGLVHVIFNMYALYAIGQTVERFFGHVRFAIVYFAGGITGSVLSVLLNGSNVTSVGASGAVFAIFGAEMVFLYKHRKLLGEMARWQLRQLIIVAGINFAYGLATTLNTDGVRIDNWGHIGGMLGGLAVSWLICPLLIPRRHPTDAQGLAISDINPLEKSYQSVLAYVSALLIVLIAASYIARGGI